MAANAMTPLEYFDNYYQDKANGFRDMLKLSDQDKITYEELLSTLIKINDNRNDFSTQVKGEGLEKLATFLIKKTKMLKVYKNLHTSTNEIDVLSVLTPAGKDFISHLPFDDSCVLCECKNYADTIGVTWVGKFYSLLKQYRCNLGIIFSYYGLSGKDWEDGVGLTKKICLRDNVCLINLNIEDFNRIKDGESIINIISNKIESLKFDVNFNELITLHPAQEQN